MREQVRLTVEGADYVGWESVELVRSIEAVCGSFRVSVSDRRTAAGFFPIPEGGACDVYVGRELYLSGFVDAVDATVASDAHEVEVRGRDLAQDLVDCCPVDLPAQFFGVSLLELGRTLAAPYGLEVLLQPGLEEPEPFELFTMQPGETSHEMLERACRMRGFLLTSNALGAVVLTRGSDSRAERPIVWGPGVEQASLRIDRSQRFARYVVRGQRPGTDLAFGEDCAELEGEATDPVPRPARALAIVPEGPVDDELSQRRATWEANVRAARGSTLAVTLTGWRQGGSRGPVWAPNVLVPVRIPMLHVDGDWLVAGVRLLLDRRSGSRAELALTRPDAYLPQPPRRDEEPGFGADLGDEEGG